MKRWTLRILLFAALGAVTTVGVAWGCARWSVAGERLFDGNSPLFPSNEIQQDEYRWLEARGVEPYPGCKIALSATRGFGFARIEFWEFLEGMFERQPTVAGGGGCVLQRTESGWPLRSLTCHEHLDRAAEAANPGGPFTQRQLFPLVDGFDVTEEIDVGGPWPIKRPLPLRPIWPGFLIDTLFYGAIWFALFAGFGATKRAIRRRRGRCPMCGYDLRGALDTGCPECGWNRSPA